MKSKLMTVEILTYTLDTKVTSAKNESTSIEILPCPLDVKVNSTERLKAK